MDRRESEALDNHITGHYGEDQFSDEKVMAIKVGGEWHCVDDGDGDLLDSVTLTEQCDSCGSPKQAPFMLFMVQPAYIQPLYECGYCGFQPEMKMMDQDEVVF